MTNAIASRNGTRAAGSKSAGTSIEVPRIDIQKLRVTLIGDSPLITHQWSEKAKKEMLDKQMKKAVTAKAAKDPWVDFCESLYWLDGMPETPTPEHVATARFGFKSVAFKAAAVTAANDLDLKMTQMRRRFHVEGEFVEIEGGPPVMREDMVRVGMGTADLRYRGEFQNWRARLVIAYNATVISPAQIVNLLNLAGFGVGVGEWRSEKDGNNGRFHVADEAELGKAG